MFLSFEMSCTIWYTYSMETKQCANCLEEKPITSFCVRRRTRIRNGEPYIYVNIPNECKACEHSKRTVFNVEHREEQRAYSKRRWQDPVYKERTKAYWAGKGKDVQAAYRKTTKSEERLKRYYATEKGQLYLRNKWKRHAEKRLTQIEASVHPLTPREWRAIVRLYAGLCAYCGKPWKTKRSRKPSMDHVIPLAKGGEHRKDNVVPTCWPCNRTKGAETWIPRIPVSPISVLVQQTTCLAPDDRVGN